MRNDANLLEPAQLYTVKSLHVGLIHIVLGRFLPKRCNQQPQGVTMQQMP